MDSDSFSNLFISMSKAKSHNMFALFDLHVFLKSLCGPFYKEKNETAFRKLLY